MVGDYALVKPIWNIIRVRAVKFNFPGPNLGIGEGMCVIEPLPYVCPISFELKGKLKFVIFETWRWGLLYHVI